MSCSFVIFELPKSIKIMDFRKPTKAEISPSEQPGVTPVEFQYASSKTMTQFFPELVTVITRWAAWSAAALLFPPWEPTRWQPLSYHEPVLRTMNYPFIDPLAISSRHPRHQPWFPSWTMDNHGIKPRDSVEASKSLLRPRPSAPRWSWARGPGPVATMVHDAIGVVDDVAT